MHPQRQLLSARDIKVHFPVKPGGANGNAKRVSAVNGVSFDVYRGETLGLVGESGCGKTTLGRALLRLGHGIVTGRMSFDGQDLSDLDAGSFRQLRKKMQMIFQDPFGSLNPRLTVGQMLGEVLAVHRIAKGEEARKRTFELLDLVGLNREYANRYPHEFSGGQRQRVGIARALAVGPEFIICDEPVSALDVSIQSQIINLLKDLQRDLGLTYLFIAHDLSVVEYISDRVAVMYLGKIVEITSSEELYSNPLHPYTRALLSAVPIPDPDAKRERTLLKGDLPGPLNIPSGCSFHPRCPVAKPECGRKEPLLRPLAEHTEHQVSCLLYE
ncbi:MAG: ATP-binding cassette domain-containing protein [Chlorobium sp.]|uniref:ABC transporter ATP-binding protein n=1 Tax=Chlorobium sp. TaxID=1095 RepID=UPI0025C565CB|nr:oligopeptide/dipeptide ABC transporter ATP-binding protein [Chlorobium sp.]MCF8217057.1 ATP-binding cassette domain-containing protein [Chlorobium sp.]MCF8271868.1 ATP-binding cassette domain-containing protein [Chlorobium sp.]MCF8288274.1 ATP-binding cassette domain-containing protein [Chlorobium sp.]MCF8291824.1 ATP-binding cassette domain-containing protein [Chlorobium sp.]MCF8385974.1 ATP-binding cassette domain-containing protein [Chlorobium sp.]